MSGPTSVASTVVADDSLAAASTTFHQESLIERALDKDSLHADAGLARVIEGAWAVERQPRRGWANRHDDQSRIGAQLQQDALAAERSFNSQPKRGPSRLKLTA